MNFNEEIIVDDRLLEETIQDNAKLSDSLGTYLKEIGKYNVLTPEEEIQLFTEIKNGNAQAREKIINSNLKLVVFIAKRYTGVIRETNIDIMDLIQCGNNGLISAVDKFELGKGTKFSTYAFWWIKQSITRFLSERRNFIRIPSYLYGLSTKLNLYCDDYLKRNGVKPSVKELSDIFDVPEEMIEKALSAQIPVRSSDAPVDEEKETPLIDMISSDEDMSEDVEKRILVEQILQIAKECLTQKEYEILMLRIGFDSNREYTLEELAEKYGLTRERIRQIHIKAVEKLQKKVNAKI